MLAEQVYIGSGLVTLLVIILLVVLILRFLR